MHDTADLVNIKVVVYLSPIIGDIQELATIWCRQLIRPRPRVVGEKGLFKFNSCSLHDQNIILEHIQLKIFHKIAYTTKNDSLRHSPINFYSSSKIFTTKNYVIWKLQMHNSV